MSVQQDQRENHILETLELGRRRPPSFTAEWLDMSHGAGGKASHKLIEGLLLPALRNAALDPLGDAAILNCGDTRLALTTDAYVVRPLRFPGGSIGELAVNGTVNDLAVSGATPIALAAALIIEEGLETAILRREIEAMAAAARRANVSITTGDTKMVERGKGDGLYIITTGLGLADPKLALSAMAVRPGDKILCSGTLGDHGIAILIARGNLDLEAEVRSDTRPLTPLTVALIAAVG
ncbi:MAG TPA: AIR synthase related protein, partial [Chloroflexota bacterium]